MAANTHYSARFANIFFVNKEIISDICWCDLFLVYQRNLCTDSFLSHFAHTYNNNHKRGTALYILSSSTGATRGMIKITDSGDSPGRIKFFKLSVPAGPHPINSRDVCARALCTIGSHHIVNLSTG